MRPQELVRSFSDQDDIHFSAPLQPQQNEPQCGLGVFGYHWNPVCLQKFANFKVFVVVLAHLGLIHGACAGYFAQTAYTAADIYHVNRRIVDWLLIGSEVTQGIFGLCISYWGNKGHRPQWIGFFAAFQGVMCFLVIIPHFVHGLEDADVVTNKDITSFLCKVTSDVHKHITSNNPEWVLVVLLFAIQLGIGLTNTCFLALGLSYIDDNVKKKNSPLLMGACMAAKHFGPKVGVLIAWLFFTGSKKVYSWWIGWPVLSVILVSIAIIISMFPVILPARAINDVASSILSQATGIHFIEPVKSPYQQDPNASTGKYMESSFLIPSEPDNSAFDDMASTRLAISLLKPLLVSLAVLVTGLAISKIAPKPNKLAAWNIFISLLAAVFYISYIFLDCDSLKIRWLHRGPNTGLSHLCNSGCACPKDMIYSPVCAEDSSYTYFSPCHAGCSRIETTGDVMIFHNCSCVMDFHQNFTKANVGPCNDGECSIHWTLIQVMGVISAALIGSGLVGNILINFRCIQPQDKSLVVGLELMVVGLIAYIPGRILYIIVADSACLLEGENAWECKMYDSQYFGLYVNMFTAGLLLISAILDGFVCYFARVLPLYKEDTISSDNEDYELDEANISKTRKKLRTRRATPAFQRRRKDYSSSETLDENSGSDDQESEEEASQKVQKRLINLNHSNESNQSSATNERHQPLSTNF